MFKGPVHQNGNSRPDNEAQKPSDEELMLQIRAEMAMHLPRSSTATTVSY
jgi:hypothetical protein